MTAQPIRTKIRRLYVPNAVYFITCVTRERHPTFASEPNIELLRETMGRFKEIHPFQMRTYAFMHDHLHLLISVSNETSISKITHSIQRNFTVNYKKAHSLTESVKMWQHGFWDHVIRDERDFANHFHYIHYNPIKHGYVSKPEDYPYTSFHTYVERGWYEIGWEHTEPDFLKNLDFE